MDGVRVQIVITYMNDGSLSVQAPMQDKILCYGILEAARDVVKEYKPEQGGLLVPVIPNGILR